MKELPYEHLAMQNAVLPHELTDFDVLAYYALCHVYRLYNDKLIGKEQGACMKRQIVLAHNKCESFRNSAAHVADIYKYTEAARAAVRKNPCAETALALADCVDGRGWEKFERSK